MVPPFQTCLLIDDNPLDNFINTLLILKSNFSKEVIAMESSEEALRSLGDGAIKPDVIFLDINIPVMDGFQFLKEYANLGIMKDTAKIFILSSSLDPRDISEAENNKYVIKFIEKTLTAEKLFEIMVVYKMAPVDNSNDAPTLTRLSA